VSGDVDTGAGRAAAQPAVAAAVPIREPTPVIAASDATRDKPPGTAAPPGGASPVIGPPDKPELAVGAAFAGGFVLAFILKKITN
jgi:hypothetical protein